MKKLFAGFVVLALLIGGGLFAAMSMIPLDKIQAEAKAQIKAKTGRDISFEKMDVMFWPNVGVHLTGVKVGNVSWATDKTMASLDGLDVQLAVMPLLKKQVEVKKFILQKPIINLEKKADGTNNWTFGTGGSDQTSGGAGGASVPSDIGFSFSNLEITDGQVTFNKAGQKTVVSKLNITFKMPTLASATKVGGDFEYLSKPVNFDVTIEKIMDLIAGKTSPGSFDVKTDTANFNVNGDFSTTGTLLSGDVSADIKSLSGFLTWVTGTQAEKLPFEKIEFKSVADVSAEKFSLKDAALSLDDISAKGDVRVNMAGTRPDVFARLNIGKINLDRFVSGANTESKAAPASNSAAGWDRAPIDFTGLKAVDADVVLDTEGFSLKGIDVGASKLNISVQDGNLKLTSSEAALLGGSFKSDMSLQTAPSTPQLSFNFDMKGVEANPVLSTFAGFDKLSGKVDTSVNVTTAGKSQKEIMGALNGSGAAVFKNGSLKGIDLLNIAKAIQGGLASMNVGDGKTDFVELGGTFKITNGVAHNDDLKMKGPLLQCTGAGDVNLPAKTVSYRVVPMLTASSVVDNASGIKIPVVISGPFSNISVRPDLEGAVTDLINNPDAINNTLKGAKAQGKELLNNLKDVKNNPADAIGNLLGGGGLFGAKKKAVAPVVAPAVAPVVAPVVTPAPVAPADVPESPATAPEVTDAPPVE